MIKAAVDIYGFQKRWVADTSRFKAGNMARQIGKSFVIALEAVLDSAQTDKDWILLSAGERQSKELMAKCKMHLEAIKVAASDIEQDEEFFNDSKITILTIHLPNRAKIIGLPANPDTARGFSGNVVLDEFAFHKDSFAIWKALFPTISRGYKIRVVSTPQGKSNQFYKLMTGDNGFSKHTVDIMQAVADGVPHNIEELKAGVDDEETWQQEYMCQFIDEATAYLTYELIAGCESSSASEELSGDVKDTYIGIDVGRKKDLTVIWVAEQIGDVYWTRAVDCLYKTPFTHQYNHITDAIRKTKARRVCIDATGIGAQLAEQLIEKFGTSKVEPVVFSNNTKQDMAVRCLKMFQDRQVRIPISNKIRNDLHSVKKTVTAAGNIRFDAERTADGHSDRFWAMALALMATDKGIEPAIYIL